MKFQARRPIGIGDRLVAVGEILAGEELGEGLERLLELEALAESASNDAEEKPVRGRKQE